MTAEKAVWKSRRCRTGMRSGDFGGGEGGAKSDIWLWKDDQTNLMGGYV